MFVVPSPIPITRCLAYVKATIHDEKRFRTGKHTCPTPSGVWQAALRGNFMSDIVRPSNQALGFEDFAANKNHKHLRPGPVKPKSATLKVGARLPANLVLEIEACARQSGVCKTDIMRTWLEAGSKAT
ncbi:hypothetical protein Q9L58_010954, partial [Maublancomyces gigas]